jgi:hypothetical protein
MASPHPELPFSGSTPQSRHASYLGALAATRTAESKRAQYWHFLKTHGPATDEEAEIALHMKRSSVCSTRDYLVKHGLVTACEEFRRGCSGVKLSLWRLTTDDEERASRFAQLTLRGGA